MRHDEVGERAVHDAEHDPVQQAAADWFARLRDPNVSLEDTLAWQSWMNADDRHAKAFARMEEVSDTLALLQMNPPRPPSTTRWDSYDGSMAVSDWQTQRRSSVRRWALAASVGVLGVAAALVVGTGRLHSPDTVFATAVGENRTVQLADGSQITLGGNSRIEVALSTRMRHIELSQGEAFFSVAKDPSRPFKVHAGRATVAAVGTEFNVRRSSERVVVDVVEGRVIVEPVSAFVPNVVLRQFRPKLVPVSVGAGEETVVGDFAVEPATSVSDIGSATAWQSGRLSFRMQPLREVLEDVNRYSQKPIVLEDAAIGDLLVTGTVMGANVTGWTASLETALDIDAVEEPDRIVLKRAR